LQTAQEKKSDNNLTVNVEPGQPTEATIEVEEAVTVSGRFIDPKTGKAPEGQYYLLPEKEGAGNTSYHPVNADGSWRAELTEGSYTLSYAKATSMNERKEIKKIKVERGKKIDEIVVEIKNDVK